MYGECIYTCKQLKRIWSIEGLLKEAYRAVSNGEMRIARLLHSAGGCHRIWNRIGVGFCDRSGIITNQVICHTHHIQIWERPVVNDEFLHHNNTHHTMSGKINK